MGVAALIDGLCLSGGARKYQALVWNEQSGVFDVRERDFAVGLPRPHEIWVQKLKREDAGAAAHPAPKAPFEALVAQTEAILAALSGHGTDERYRTGRFDMRNVRQTRVAGKLGPGFARRNLWLLEEPDDPPVTTVHGGRVS